MFSQEPESTCTGYLDLSLQIFMLGLAGCPTQVQSLFTSDPCAESRGFRFETFVSALKYIMRASLDYILQSFQVSIGMQGARHFQILLLSAEVAGGSTYPRLYAIGSS